MASDNDKPGQECSNEPWSSFDGQIARQQPFLEALIRTIGVPLADALDVQQRSNPYLIEYRARYQPGTNFQAWAAQVVRYRLKIE